MPRSSIILAVGYLCFLEAIVSAEPIVLAEVHGVTLSAIPLDSPEGFQRVLLRFKSPEDTKIVTFHDLQIGGEFRGEGNPTQVCLDALCASHSSFTPPGATWHAAWTRYDTHLLITPDMVGGGAGDAYAGIHDLNDGRYGDQGLPKLSDELPVSALVGALVGEGPLRMNQFNDAFFLKEEYQSNSIDFAQVVFRDEPDRTPVPLTIGVLGSGIVDAGVNGSTVFFDRVPIIVPEPSGAGLTKLLLVSMFMLFRSRLRATTLAASF